MLHIHRAERADGLVEALGRLLADPLPDPFAPDVIAVPTRGMERWLTQRMSGSHGSASGSIPEAAATASPASRRGVGNSTFAQMPSARPGVAPRLADIRCVSQRSIPRVGTAMTSGAKGSVSGSARRRPSAAISASARSARWM